MISQRTPDPQEPRTQTPRWALERATELSEGFLSQIEGLGLEVVGDLSSLAEPPSLSGPEAVDGHPELVPIDAAVEAVLGSGFSTRTKPESPPKPPPAGVPAAAAGQLSTAELSTMLAGRLRDRARRSWRRARRRFGAARHR
jgi:hypothetical protein